MFSKLGKFLFSSNKPAPAQEDQATDASQFRKLGNQYLDEGRLDDAEDAYRRAIAIDAHDANAHANLGMVLAEKKRDEDAAVELKTALALDSSLATPHYLLGQMAQAKGSWTAAAQHVELAVARGLDFRIACRALCNALTQCGRIGEAKSLLETHIAASPDVADYHFCLGNLYASESASDSALAAYRNAIALDPGFVDAHLCIGVIQNEQRELDGAIERFQKVLELDPTHAAALKNLGVVHTGQSNLQQAVDCQARYLAHYPHASDAGEARWALAVNRMRLLAQSDADPAALKDACLAELDALSDWCDRHDADGSAVVGSTQLFFLAYERDMNWRDVLVRYGALCSKLMKAWYDKQGFQAAPSNAPGKIRLGIVSAEIFDHSVWNAFLKGWYDGFDTTRFEIQTFFLSPAADRESDCAKARSDVFVDLRGKDLRGCVQAILDQAPAILLYPAIGMDGTTAKLASLRLAPTQIAAWGHPEGSGLPTMDYFISAEDFEPAHATLHYAERLICLPHLGCSYSRLQVETSRIDFKAGGIDIGVPLLLCPGTPVKYTPQHDAVFVEIARRLGRCRFVFFATQPSGPSDKLRHRLESAFSAAGMTLTEYCVFIPWLPRAAFYALMRHAQVFLDTLGFSGFNTAIQAVECGLPVVAFDGAFMRGRLAGGILRRAGLTELIARTEEEFIGLAVRLAGDEDYASSMRQTMAANTAALFDDAEPARALNDFLASLPQQARQN